MSSKAKENWTVLAYVSPCRNDDNEKGRLTTKNSKINPFVIKSFLEPSCQRSSKSATREIFTQNLTLIWKKVLPIIDAAFSNNTKRKKRKVANFKQFLYASQNILIFSRVFRPKTQIWHEKDHYWASAWISSVKIIQRTITAVDWRRQQTKRNFEQRSWKRKSGSQK